MSGRAAARTCVSASDGECVCAVESVCCVPQRRLRHVVSAALCDLLLGAAAGEEILPDLLCSV